MPRFSTLLFGPSCNFWNRVVRDNVFTFFIETLANLSFRPSTDEQYPLLYYARPQRARAGSIALRDANVVRWWDARLASFSGAVVPGNRDG